MSSKYITLVVVERDLVKLNETSREVYETESVLNALKIRVDCTLHFPFNQCVKKELEDMKRVSKIYYLTTEHVLCEGT